MHASKPLQEDIWAALPAGLEPYEWRRRCAFLLESVRSGQDVLDFGCGEGAFTAALSRAGAVPVGVDISERALERARASHPGLDFRSIGPGGALPLDDGTVDVAWASEVLAHVVDTARALSELRRVLRPRGLLLVTTPYHGRVRNVSLGLHGFERAFDPRGPQVRFYTRRSLRKLLEDFGFEPERIAAAGGPPLLRRMLLASATRAAPSIAARN